MTLEQWENELATLDRDAADIATFLSALDTYHLQMIGSAVHDELTFRSEGKPDDRSRLH